MNALVLDASAAVEILAETSRGDALLSEAATRRNWWVPDHFHLEVASGFRRLRLNGLINDERASKALNELAILPLLVSQTLGMLPQAWQYRSNLTMQDALYVSLAQYLEIPLLTGDARLANAPNLPVEIIYIG
ncbi:MAG: type II toxin-antitoxin system VapC family toxin [Actinomycetota bacterium]